MFAQNYMRNFNKILVSKLVIIKILVYINFNHKKLHTNVSESKAKSCQCFSKTLIY